jgi:hypothetical protein
MCNDKVDYDPLFLTDGIKPIQRDERDSRYPENIAEVTDVCYFTTPNLVGTKLFCKNLLKPEFKLTGSTA